MEFPVVVTLHWQAEQPLRQRHRLASLAGKLQKVALLLDPVQSAFWIWKKLLPTWCYGFSYHAKL